MLDTKDALIDAEIDNLAEDMNLSPEQKQQRISVLRSSKLTGTDSSGQTIVSLANTMIGSAIILYPILFVEDGMISAAIIMLVIGCIQYFTCRLLVIHNRPDEPSFNESILRICGVKIDKLNSIANGLLLFFVSCAYFLLISVNFFQITAALIKAFSSTYEQPSINKITFNSYSIQWACIICIFLCVPTVLKRKIQPILKLVKYSVYPVIAYAVFILACVIKEMAIGAINVTEYKWFDSDFSTVAGAFALSFLIHPTAAPILKRNANQSRNEKDLMYGYMLTAGIYFFVGFIGGFSCASDAQNINNHPELYSNVFDCVARHDTTEEMAFYVIGKIVQAGIFFQNYSVMPVIFFLTRKQVIALTKRPQIFVGFSIFFLIVASLFGILAIDVSIVLSFTGAIIGFIMGYFIPIYTHLKCYHYKYSESENRRRRSLLSGNLEEDLVGEMQLDSETQEQILKCNDHPKKSKKTHFIVYGAITIVGIALGIFKIYSFITHD